MSMSKVQKTNEKFYDVAFEANVPFQGCAATVYGEIVRLYCRIRYCYYNNGDIVGREICNSLMWAARQLASLLPKRERKALARLYRYRYCDGIGGEYEKSLIRLGYFLRRYLKENSEKLLATPFHE